MSIVQTNRIKWKNIVLGDHAYINITYVSNNNIVLIPRAKGVRVYSTEQLGGGYYKITVNAILTKSSRILLEEALLDADNVYDLTSSGTLLLDDLGTSVELTNCYLDDWTSNGDDSKLTNITYSFIKSL